MKQLVWNQPVSKLASWCRLRRQERDSSEKVVCRVQHMQACKLVLLVTPAVVCLFGCRTLCGEQGLDKLIQAEPETALRACAAPILLHLSCTSIYVTCTMSPAPILSMSPQAHPISCYWLLRLHSAHLKDVAGSYWPGPGTPYRAFPRLSSASGATYGSFGGLSAGTGDTGIVRA